MCSVGINSTFFMFQGVYEESSLEAHLHHMSVGGKMVFDSPSSLQFNRFFG